MIKKFLKLLGNTGLITVCAILGAWGGQEKKWLRRFVFPAVIMIYTLYVVHNFWVATIYSISIWLSIGYGVPSQNDEGSALGRFFFKMFHQKELWTNIFTRGTVGLLISISMLSVPFITWNWMSYFIGSLLIIMIWALISWRGFGEIPVQLFGKTINLLKVDLTVYAVTTCGILLIIHGWVG